MQSNNNDAVNTPPVDNRLHVLLVTGIPTLESVQILVEEDRQRLAHENKDWEILPIHCTCINHFVSLKIVKYLVDCYPVGLKTNSEYGGLPIQFACEVEYSVEVVNFLFTRISRRPPTGMQ